MRRDREWARRWGVALALLAAGCSRSFHGQPIDPARLAPEIAVELPGRPPFRLSEQRGKVALVTFGFTHCPDVCPLTLGRVKGLYRKLGARSDRVVTAFVSVDPERDLPEQLSEYVAAFDPRIVPVHLSPPKLWQVLAGYGATASRRESQPGRSGSDSAYYSVDHTSGFFLVDTRGRLRLRVPHDASEEQLRNDVTRLLEEEGR